MEQLQLDLQEYYGTTKLKVLELTTTAATTIKRAPKFKISGVGSTATAKVQITQPDSTSSLVDGSRLINDITSQTSQPTLSALSSALAAPACMFSSLVTFESPFQHKISSVSCFGILCIYCSVL